MEHLMKVGARRVQIHFISETGVLQKNSRRVLTRDHDHHKMKFRAGQRMSM